MRVINIIGILAFYIAIIWKSYRKSRVKSIEICFFIKNLHANFNKSAIPII